MFVLNNLSVHTRLTAWHTLVQVIYSGRLEHHGAGFFFHSIPPPENEGHQ